MNQRLQQVLENKPDNYILPFFWQHGESEELLREGMAKIAESSIGAVCVESRPHPDFLGEKWWRDLDVIMDEAKKRGMKVWVLDDAHFPSGMCNGKISDDSPYGKEYLTHVYTDVPGPLNGHAFMINLMPGEKLLGVVMGKLDRTRPDILTEIRDLSDTVRDGKVYADIPAGTWSVMVLKTTRRGSGRRNYINTIDHEAVRFFLDTVYEEHYAHYRNEFGNTFAGFFSDEPEIGNGASEHGHHLHAGQPDICLPWGSELENNLKCTWGDEYIVRLASLFAEVKPETGAFSAANRVLFTDYVSRLYGKNFCSQIGDWCRAHGVEYIGHVIEDDGRHAQLGLGTAHFFRALWGQDMAGIDIVLQQLRPELDDFPFHAVGGVGTYNGEFFHYGLAKLGSSLAKLDPKKKGRTMCEVFGAYGWAEGLKQMKWIIDHMLVNGVNYFVPHAFSMKDFPDRDCPPHFYARGNNPQFPYFRKLMEYTNRVSHLINGGSSRVSVALLYTAEQEWAGDVIQFEKAAKELTRSQIDFTVVWGDYLESTRMEAGKLYLGCPSENPEDEQPGTEDYRSQTKVVEDAASALIICGSRWLPEKIAKQVVRAVENGIAVYALGSMPEILTAGEHEEIRFKEMIEIMKNRIRVIPEGTLVENLWEAGAYEIRTDISQPWLRSFHYSRNEADYWLFFNEAAYTSIDTELVFRETPSSACWYDPWLNRISWHGQLYTGSMPPVDNKTAFRNQSIGKDKGVCADSLQEETGITGTRLHLSPYEMQILIIPHDGTSEIASSKDRSEINSQEGGRNHGKWTGKYILPESGWDIAIKPAGSDAFHDIDYNKLGDLSRPELEPYFSGTIRYCNEFYLPEDTKPEFLEIDKVYETACVYINGVEAGIRIAPPYCFEVKSLLRQGKNKLEIYVINTLVHNQRDYLSMTMPMEPSGLIGPVAFCSKAEMP